MPENTVSVCRPGKFGNPFIVGTDGTDAECVEKFRLFLDSKIAGMLGSGIRRAAQYELRGKNLACWCKVGEPCHADILLEIANA